MGAALLAVLLKLLAPHAAGHGASANSSDAGTSNAGGTGDGGTWSGLDSRALSLPPELDPNGPGHRAVEGAVSGDEAAGVRRSAPRASDELSYDELMGSRLGELDSCATWSPGGAAVRGWALLDWSIQANGKPVQLQVIQSTLNAPLFEACLLRQMGFWRFPPPAEGNRHVRQQLFFDIPARDLGSSDAPGSVEGGH